MLIRTEIASDILSIERFVQRCKGDISFIETLRELRQQGALALSMLALDDEGQIQGYVAFSTVYNHQQDCGWLWLFPLVIDQQQQHSHLKQQLLQEGLDSLYGFGYAAVIDFYQDNRPPFAGFQLADGLKLLGQSQAKMAVYPLHQSNAALMQQQFQLSLALNLPDLASLSG